MADEEVPPEVKRKLMRDYAEMANLLPKYPAPQVTTNVQVNVEKPEWK